MADKHLTANIAYWRMLRNAELQQLAKLIGVSRQTFKRKCDDCGFTVKELKILARYLKCTVSDLTKGI